MLVFMGGVIAIPATLCRIMDRPDARWLEKHEKDFDPAKAKSELRERRPDWVMVSNSMLDTRLNERTLSDRSGHTVSQIFLHGSASAVWFLTMKRVVAESGVKPRIVSLFFRASDLTWPDRKIAGDQEQTIMALDGKDQPEWQQVMCRGDGDLIRLRKVVAETLDALFPSQFMTDGSRRAVQRWSQRATRVGTRMNNSQRLDELNDRFSLAHLRHDLGSDAALNTGLEAGAGQENADDESNRNVYRNGPRKFDPSPDASFLPHMVALAKREGFKLHVHRVMQRPTPDGPRNDSPETQQYMSDLRNYMEQNGCLFTDESLDPTLTLDMYADGDHISSDPDVQKRYLENFWHRMEPLIGSGNPRH